MILAYPVMIADNIYRALTMGQALFLALNAFEFKLQVS